MSKDYSDFLKTKLSKDNFDKLLALNSSEVVDFVGEYVELCNPKSVFVRSDSLEDIGYLREKSIFLGEEVKLAIDGHTMHFDGFLDQARDKKRTKYLLSANSQGKDYLNSIEREEGIKEIRDNLSNIMAGKEMFVCFFCLGPLNSDFSISAVQITDSAYVAHSEEILYRPGYEQFKKNKGKFFRFVHSAGELEANISKNVEKRRVYIDLESDLVYSVNTQYAGNAVGLKKLALRLAIKKAFAEGWLAEHMFIMGVSDSEDKKDYFCGAYPSMCGKTSTAMVSGESIVGDDIAYLRSRNGKVYAVNVERGIFGIIKGVCRDEDPVLFKFLTKEGEVIFSNILMDENGGVFWIGKDKNVPRNGINFSGRWVLGETDQNGIEVAPSHKNARYTIRLKNLENVDDQLENPEGVEIKAMIYGGRDSDTLVPVEEALSWSQGIVTKAASLESETTAATLGEEGVRVFNPMSNMDFLSIPLGSYLDMNLKFAKDLPEPPLVFSVNYFLKGKDDKFLNEIQDKRVWLKWIRLRVNNKAGVLMAPTGLIPKYEDLKFLFKNVLKKEYKEADYIEQFSLRVPENLAKIERVRNIYKDLKDIPSCLFEELDYQEKRLKKCQVAFGDYVEPKNFRENT